jgi:hypothetical protein
MGKGVPISIGKWNAAVGETVEALVLAIVGAIIDIPGSGMGGVTVRTPDAPQPAWLKPSNNKANATAIQPQLLLVFFLLCMRSLFFCSGFSIIHSSLKYHLETEAVHMIRRCAVMAILLLIIVSFLANRACAEWRGRCPPEPVLGSNNQVDISF